MWLSILSPPGVPILGVVRVGGGPAARTGGQRAPAPGLGRADDQDETKDIDHGRLAYFTETTIPDDFRKLTEGTTSITLEVDETTAVYPWEMIAHKRFAKTSFVSQNVAVSRQFRSLLSPPPPSPPPLNNQLRALVIADPAPGLLALAGARREGLAVVDVLEQARIAWGGRYDIRSKFVLVPGRTSKSSQFSRSYVPKDPWKAPSRVILSTSQC